MNKIIKRLDGNYEIKISFDITEHGHAFGMPRNYNLSKVQQLVRSKRVQNDIKNGYAICMYGHGARDKGQGYLANERNAKTGEEQEPIGKITSLSIRDKIITYTALLAVTPTNKTESVVKLINVAIGGFSFVWDIENGIFFGADYVLSPNFNGNRVIVESVCGSGGCMLDSSIDKTVTDNIGTHIELFDEAKDLLLHQDDVLDAIKIKDKMKALKDEINTLNQKIVEKNIIIENINTQKEALEDNIKRYKNKIQSIDLDAIEAENEELQKTTQAAIAELDDILEAIKANGLEYKNGKLSVSLDAFGGLLVPVKKENVSLDEIAAQLKKPIQNETKNNMINWGY